MLALGLALSRASTGAANSEGIAFARARGDAENRGPWDLALRQKPEQRLGRGEVASHFEVFRISGEALPQRQQA